MNFMCIEALRMYKPKVFPPVPAFYNQNVMFKTYISYLNNY